MYILALEILKETTRGDTTTISKETVHASIKATRWQGTETDQNNYNPLKAKFIFNVFSTKEVHVNPSLHSFFPLYIYTVSLSSPWLVQSIYQSAKITRVIRGKREKEKGEQRRKNNVWFPFHFIFRNGWFCNYSCVYKKSYCLPCFSFLNK